MEEGKALLSKFNHNNLNPSCSWRAIAGGDRDRRKFRCGAHLACGVMVRLLEQDGKCKLQILAGVEHAVERDQLDRSNAALSREQKRELKIAMRHGGTASEVMKDAQAAALTEGARMHPSGVGVEGAPCLPLCVLPFACDARVSDGRDAPALHMNARECVRSERIRVHLQASTCICAHARAYARIATHPRACMRIHAHTRATHKNASGLHSIHGRHASLRIATHLRACEPIHVHLTHAHPNASMVCTHPCASARARIRTHRHASKYICAHKRASHTRASHCDALQCIHIHIRMECVSGCRQDATAANAANRMNASD